MDLFKFLKNQDFKVVTCFKVKKYLPNLGFLLFNYFRKTNNSYRFSFINSDESSAHDYQAQLAQTFLGDKTCYWLSDISFYKKPTSKAWEKLVLNYSGPNSILFFDSSDKVSSSNSKSFCLVNIPENITKKEFTSLVKVLFNPESLNSSFINSIFKTSSKIELDSAITLLNYYSVIGKSSEEFISNWLNKIVVSEQSTFLLAQYFFAQDKKLFFDSWFYFINSLPIEYWIAFFSEQLWQAITFIKRANLNITDAKKHAKRLPFSFINKDWQNYKNKIDFLVKAHNELYLIDYKLKNGSTYSLDIWLNKFFLDKF